MGGCFLIQQHLHTTGSVKTLCIFYQQEPIFNMLTTCLKMLNLSFIKHHQSRKLYQLLMVGYLNHQLLAWTKLKSLDTRSKSVSKKVLCKIQISSEEDIVDLTDDSMNNYLIRNIHISYKHWKINQAKRRPWNRAICKFYFIIKCLFS